MPRSTDNDRLLQVLSPRNKQGAAIFSRRKSKKITDLNDLNAQELAYAQAYSATLKAAGWSWRYISDTLNIQGSLVKAWAEDETWQTMCAKVATDITDGAIEHLKRHNIDLIEMLLELARTAVDESVKLRAIESALDRGGIAKVNKSESVVTKKNEHDMSDDFWSKLEGLPIETQQKVARLTEELETLVSEARGTE